MKPDSAPSLSDTKRDIVISFLEIGTGLFEVSDFLDPKNESDLISRAVVSLRFVIDITLSEVDLTKEGESEKILKYKADYLERFSAMRKKFQETAGIQAKMDYFREICSNLLREEDKIRLKTDEVPDQEINVPERQKLASNLQAELKIILAKFSLKDFENDAITQRYSAFLNTLLKRIDEGPWFNSTLLTLQQYEILHILKTKLSTKNGNNMMQAVDEWFDEIKPLSEEFLLILESVKIQPDGRFEVKWSPSDIQKKAFVPTETSETKANCKVKWSPVGIQKNAFVGIEPLETEELMDIEEIEAEAVLEVESSLEVEETKKTTEQLEEGLKAIRLQIFNYFSSILWSNFSDSNVVNAALVEIMETLTTQFKQISPEKRARFQELWPAIGEGLQQGLSSSINGSRLKFLEQWLANGRNMRQRITAKPQDAPHLSNEISPAQSAAAFN